MTDGNGSPGEKTGANGANPREVKLADGRVLTVNLNGWHWEDVREYTSIAIPPRLPERNDFASEAEKAEYEAKRLAVIEAERAALLRVFEMRAMTCGLTVQDVAALGFEDQTRLGRKIIQLITEPVEADPN